jgi:SAM-dependent methyltransferase
LDRVSFEQGDAQVHPFPAAAFDMAVSRFGTMFFGDPAAAFANVGRALRPGGRLAFLSVRNLAGHGVGPVLAAMAPHVPQAGEPIAVRALSLADPAVVRAVLADAGFADVTVTPVDAAQVWGRDAVDAAAFLGDWGPVRRLLGRVDAATAARARDALAAALRQHEDSDAVRVRSAAWLVTAARP